MTIVWLLLAAALVVVGHRAGEIRRALGGSSGLLARTVSVTHRGAQVGAAALVVWAGVGLVPGMAPQLQWGLFGAGVLIALLAARAVLPDVFSSLVILFERRLRAGIRVEGPGFGGTVIDTGWRSTRLRTPQGVIEVGNRVLLSGPVRMTRAAEHELVLNLGETRSNAAETRHMIEDAVLASAWTPPDPQVRVHRDPRDSSRWVVHTRLLDLRFAPVFDASLPERLESILAGEDELHLPLGSGLTLSSEDSSPTLGDRLV